MAVDTPYPLGTSVAPVRLATYGVTPGALASLVDVLVGRAGAPGQLPVDVPGSSAVAADHYSAAT